MNETKTSEHTFKGMKFTLLQKPGQSRQAASSDSFLVVKSRNQPEPSERENLDHDAPAWSAFRLPPHLVDQDAGLTLSSKTTWQLS